MVRRRSSAQCTITLMDVRFEDGIHITPSPTQLDTPPFPPPPPHDGRVCSLSRYNVASRELSWCPVRRRDHWKSHGFPRREPMLYRELPWEILWEPCQIHNNAKLCSFVDLRPLAVPLMGAPITSSVCILSCCMTAGSGRREVGAFLSLRRR